MKLRNKLFLGYITTVVLVMSLFGIVVNMLTMQDEKNHDTVARSYEVVRLARTVDKEANNTGRILREHMLEMSGQLAQKDIDEIEGSRLRANAAVEALVSLGLDQKNRSRSLIAKIKAANDVYSDVAKETLGLIKADNTEAVANLLVNQYKEVQIDLLTTAEELIKYEEEEMSKVFPVSKVIYGGELQQIFIYVCLVFVIGIVVVTVIVRNVTSNLSKVTRVIREVNLKAVENFPRIEITSSDEIGEISKAYNQMAAFLEKYISQEKKFNKATQEQSWLNSRLAELSTMYQGIQNLETMTQLFMNKVAPMVGASYGIFYIKTGGKDNKYLSKLGSYAYNNSEVGLKGFSFGEGLVGQCALENRRIILNKVPENYFAKITSGLGMTSPGNIMLCPVEFEGQVLAVVEFASLETFSELQIKLLEETIRNLGTTINRIESYMQVEELLKEAQALTEELQAQSEHLNSQQEELRNVNEKLEEQFNHSEQKSRELQKIKEALEEKNKQIILTSKYKSEFLANVSHELRTPLNSMLILAQMLAANTDANLTPKQVEYLNTIYSSGVDLLTLINDILDLSKIESGKMDINMAETSLQELKDFVEKQFMPLADQKGIKFSTQVSKDIPKVFYTDEYRVKQILQNILSNAFKFTEQGEITMVVEKAQQDLLAISVTDTGTGIPDDKQELIFEAFRQADGTTDRKYGGTGLGLSISRELATLLGGRINLASTEGVGSTFTLLLPIAKQKETKVTAMVQAIEEIKDEEEVAASLADGKENFRQLTNAKVCLEGKKVLLVDDDMRNIYALTTVLEKQAVNVIFSENGREALQMLRENPEIDLVLMDIMMPEMDGYDAMQEIRKVPEFANLPIIALTAKAMKSDRKRCIEAGASDYISKPVNIEQLMSLMRVWLQ